MRAATHPVPARLRTRRGRLLLAVVGLAALALAAACGQDEEGEIGPADSALGSSADLDAAREVAADRGAHDGAIDAATADYLRVATLHDLFTIEAGELARARAQTDAVQQMAVRLAEDHRRLSAQLKGAAAAAGAEATTPSALDAAGERELESLENAADDDFDRAFIRRMESAHAEALAMQQRQAREGTLLRAVAEEALPLEESHLQQLRVIRDGLEARGAP